MAKLMLCEINLPVNKLQSFVISDECTKLSLRVIFFVLARIDVVIKSLQRLHKLAAFIRMVPTDYPLPGRIQSLNTNPKT